MRTITRLEDWFKELKGVDKLLVEKARAKDTTPWEGFWVAVPDRQAFDEITLISFNLEDFYDWEDVKWPMKIHIISSFNMMNWLPSLNPPTAELFSPTGERIYGKINTCYLWK